MERTRTNAQVVEDLRELVDTAEDLLVPSRGAVPRRLREARRRLGYAREEAVERAREAAGRADHWVHDHPWRTVGIVAAVGTFAGLLFGRRLSTRTAD
jgi:ElaB/YqjD/DUF883 family membrane-anchored ribosome-binding protein